MFFKFSEFFCSTLNLFFSFDLIDSKKQTQSPRFQIATALFQLQQVVKLISTTQTTSRLAISRNRRSVFLSKTATNCLVNQTSNWLTADLQKRFRQKTREKERKTKPHSLRISFFSPENTLHLNPQRKIKRRDSATTNRTKSIVNTHCKISGNSNKEKSTPFSRRIKRG